MSRPRIRTIKPEIWQDEGIGHVGPWERLLFLGLITMADDDGRLRALPSAITGHIFPYDDVPTRKLAGWLEALRSAGLIYLYEHHGTPYCQIKGWAKHQKINRKAESKLPPYSRNGHDSFSERVVSKS